MPVNVGGLNVVFQALTDGVSKGFKSIKSELSSLQNSFKKTDLEIGGKKDPFSDMVKKAEAASKNLKRNFNSWSANAEKAGKSLDEITKQAIEYERVSKRLAAIQKTAGGGLTLAGFGVKGLGQDDLNKVLSGDQFKKSLLAFKGFNQQVDNSIDNLIKRINSKKQLTSNALAGYFGNMKQQIEKGSGKVIGEYKELSKKLHNESQKMAQKMEKDTGVFSPAWLKARLWWFVQLRLFWEAWRMAGEIMRSAVEYQRQLSRAMRTANSEIMTQTEIAEKYGSMMKDAVVAHNVGWEEAAEVLYQLTSAGLSSEEAMSGLNASLSLTTALEGDVRNTTKLLAGIYRNFGESLGEVVDKQERLQYISDLITKTWKTTQIEISEYTDAMKMASAMSKVAGLNLRQVNSMIAVMHDHMIKAGRSGRSLQNILMRIARSPQQFAEIFQIDVDPTQPLDLITIMDKLQTKMKSGEMSVARLSAIFERFGLRAAPALATLVEYWDEYHDKMKDTEDVAGATEKAELERLNNVGDQFSIFVKNVEAGMVHTLEPAFKVLRDILKDINSEFKQWRTTERFLKVLESMGETSPIGWNFLDTKTTPINMEEMRKAIKGVGGPDATKEYLKILEEELRLRGKFPGMRLHKAFIDASTKELKTILEYVKEPFLAQRYEIGLAHPGGAATPENIVGQYQGTKAERQWYAKYGAKTPEEKMKFAQEQIDFLSTDILPAAYAWKKTVSSPQDAEKVHKTLLDLEAEREEYENMILKIRRDKLELIENEKEREIELQRIEKDSIKPQIDRLNTERKILESKDMTQKNLDEYLALTDEIYYLEKQRAEQDAAIRIKEIEHKAEMERKEAALKDFKVENKDITKQQVALVEAELDAELQALEAQRQKAISSGKDKNVKNDLLKIQEQYNEKIANLNIDLKELEINNASTLELLRKQLSIIETNLQSVNAQLSKAGELKLSQKEINDLKKEQRKLELDITDNLEKQRRETDLIYDLNKRLEEKTRSYSELTHDLSEDFSTGIAQGIGGTLTDATGGFQAQQQEVVNLEGEIKELEQEAAELKAQGLLDQEDVNRLREINSEIERLNGEINDLEDPVKNLGDSFKKFFKDLIDNIRSAINEWIAMQIVMGVVEAVGGAASSSGSKVSVSGESMTFGQAAGVSGATGGVFNNIKAFRSFSSGGMTGRPTLALLGDNPSKKELVIPSENIQKDSVSGYTRDKNEGSGVTVVNILTKEDIAQAMMSPAGERVIINNIGRALNSNDPTIRRLGR